MDIILAVEDALAESLARAIAAAQDVNVAQCLQKRGKTYLKQRAHALGETAKIIPVLMLIDQDTPTPCPSDLRTDWLQADSPESLLFRVAVMESEAWLLADRKNVAEFLGVSMNRLPMNPDAEPDPKQTIINLAMKSRKRAIRSGLVPQRAKTASIGPEYNSLLPEFVMTQWDLDTASANSKSLARTVRCLGELKARLDPSG